MGNDPPLRMSPNDGWVGTPELPGYRAGSVIARLDDLPDVDPHHLYFDLLLLDEHGHTQDNHSGPCPALARREPVDERSRFVRVVAELVRHAPTESRGLTAIHRTLTFLRERGIEPRCLIVAAQLLDDVCSEAAVVSSLSHVLELSLGDEEAHRTMSEVVADLARQSGFASPAAQNINDGGLQSQLAYIVRTIGKIRARQYLRQLTDFEMVPSAEMFGV